MPRGTCGWRAAVAGSGGGGGGGGDGDGGGGGGGGSQLANSDAEASQIAEILPSSSVAPTLPLRPWNPNCWPQNIGFQSTN